MIASIVGEGRVDRAFGESLVRTLCPNSHVTFHAPPIAIPPGGRGVDRAIERVVLGCRYQHTHIDALLILRDSDDEPPEEVRRRLETTIARANGARPGGSPLRVALGVADPALEAWLSWALDGECNERRAAELRCDSAHHGAMRRRALKAAVYGDLNTTEPHRCAVAAAHADRIASELSSFVQSFPTGAGPMIEELQSWQELGTS